MGYKKLLNIAAVRTLAYIETNIKNGVDCKGGKFQYSKKPFYRPYEKKIASKLGGSDGEGKLYKIITGKNGKLGMIILGGYDSLKRNLYPQSYSHFLTQTGKMLRSMSALKIDDKSAIIGFSDPDSAQKAYWLNVSGAGRSRKLWRFLCISQAQEKELTEEIGNEFYQITVKKLAEIIGEQG